MNAQHWLDQHTTNAIFTDDDGNQYESLVDLLQEGVLGFCGCGQPEEALKFVRYALGYLDWRMTAVKENTPFDQIKAREAQVFGNSQIAYFFYYWADKEGLTTHGGSVPGWLEEKGEILLKVLQGLELEEN